MQRTSLIQLEPDILQMDLHNDSHQQVEATLKVTNISSNPLPGLFFCLYNQEKFEISPENFNLQPNQSKVVNVRVKLLEKEKRSSHKQYAYLKSSVVSRRVTILLNSDQQHNDNNLIILSRLTDNPNEQSMNSALSPHRNSEIQQGAEQYRAFQSPRIEQSRFTTANFEQELENYDHGARATQIYKQLSIAELESADLKRKLKVCENEKETFKRQVEALKRDSDRQHHNDNNYKALYEKEKAIYCQLKEELDKIYNDRNTVDMRRRDAEAQLHNRDVRIKHLEHENSQLKDKLVDADKQVADLKNRHLKSSKELILREEQLRHIRGELESLKQAIDTFEAERVKHIKTEFNNGKLAESNQSLQQQIDKLQSMLNQQQQQLLRIEAVKEHTEQTKDSVDKARQYLSIALESSKIESQTLKTSKQDLERALSSLALTQKQLTGKLRTAESQLEELQRERLSVNDDLLRLNHQNSQLRNQTIELQTIKAECSILKKELMDAEHKVLTLQKEVERLSREKDETTSKLKYVEECQEKYRIDVTRQFDSIRNSTGVEALRLSSTKAKSRRHKQKQLEQDTSNKDNERTQVKQIENTFQKSKGELATLYEQPQSSSRGRIRSRSINHCEDNRAKPLESLQEAMKMFDTQHSKICKQLQMHEDIELVSPSMKVLSFFRQLECKVSEITRTHKDQSEYINEIRRLKFQLIDKEAALKVRTNAANQSQQEESTKSSDKSRKLMEFVQEEMRNQFSKMQTALSFSNEKFEVLRRKLYSQYRFRILNLLSDKQKTALPRLEMLLQRFIDGLVNQTHKQALLNRHSKKQADSTKQNKMLKHRIHELDWILGEKQTAVCTRSPVQVVYNNSASSENIFQSLRLESQLLSCKAELSQVAEELTFMSQNLNNVNQQLTDAAQTIGQKDQEISKLRMHFLEVERLHKSELVDALEEMDQMRMHSMRVGELEEQLALQIEKSKSGFGLRDQLGRKKDLIKGLKDREKDLVQIIDDIRVHIQDQEKQRSDKGRSKEEIRLQQVLADLKQCNKELKAQLQKRIESEKNLADEIEKKNSQISSLKATITLKERQLNNLQMQEQSKAKAQKKRMESEIREAKATASKLQSELERAQKRLDQLEAEVVLEKQQSTKLSDEAALKEKSMMCTIRSLADVLRTIWRSIEVKVRKIRPSNNYNLINYESLAGDPMKIDVLRLYSSFADMISVIKESPGTSEGFTV